MKTVCKLVCGFLLLFLFVGCGKPSDGSGVIIVEPGAYYDIECTYVNWCSLPIRFDFQNGEVVDIPVGGEHVRYEESRGGFPEYPFMAYRSFFLEVGNCRIWVYRLTDGRLGEELYYWDNYDLMEETDAFRRYEYTFTDELFEEYGYELTQRSAYDIEYAYINQCSLPIRFDFQNGEVVDIPVEGKHVCYVTAEEGFPEYPFMPCRSFLLEVGDYRISVYRLADGRLGEELYYWDNYDLVEETDAFRRYEYTLTDELFAEYGYELPPPPAD